MTRTYLCPISQHSQQEELFDVGKILTLFEKEEVPEDSEPMKLLRERYYKWFLQLAEPFYKNKIIAFKAMVYEWAPFKIAQELGVEEIPGIPQDI